MIVRELIPFIDRTYRTVAMREGRAIEGFSMGGAGSLRLAIKYPDLFRSVVAYGAAVIKGDRAGVGEENIWLLARNNADRVRGRLAIRMVCGDKDSLCSLHLAFRDLLRSLDVPVDWVSIPDVAHDTKGLYRRVGVESLRFIQAQSGAKDQPNPR